MTITAEELRQLVFDELESLGFSFDKQGELIPPKSDKKAIRLLHKPAKEIKLKEGQAWLDGRVLSGGRMSILVLPKTRKPLSRAFWGNWRNNLGGAFRARAKKPKR